jgi:hypothetical protein
MLRGLPRRSASQETKAKLRIMASRQAARRRLFDNPAAMLREAASRANLMLDNMAKPYAVPFTGGLAAALFLFISIAPAFPVHRAITNDAPTRLNTPASLASAFALSLAPDDMVLQIEVDSEGRVVDYFVEGDHTLNPEVRKNLESTLVCTRFNPATLFGQPQAGAVRIRVRRSAMEVKG